MHKHLPKKYKMSTQDKYEIAIGILVLLALLYVGLAATVQTLEWLHALFT